MNEPATVTERPTATSRTPPPSRWPRRSGWSRGSGCSTCAPRPAARPPPWPRPTACGWWPPTSGPAGPGWWRPTPPGSAWPIGWRWWPPTARPPPWRPGSFDRVLVDAPCSGLGTLRRRADLRWRVEPEAVEPPGRPPGPAAGGRRRPGPPGRDAGVLGVHAHRGRVHRGGRPAGGGSGPTWSRSDPPGEPWRPWGRGAILLPQAAGTDGMCLVRYRRRGPPVECRACPSPSGSPPSCTPPGRRLGVRRPPRPRRPATEAPAGTVTIGGHTYRTRIAVRRPAHGGRVQGQPAAAGSTSATGST